MLTVTAVAVVAATAGPVTAVITLVTLRIANMLIKAAHGLKLHKLQQISSLHHVRRQSNQSLCRHKLPLRSASGRAHRQGLQSCSSQSSRSSRWMQRLVPRLSLLSPAAGRSLTKPAAAAAQHKAHDQAQHSASAALLAPTSSNRSSSGHLP